MRSFFLGFFLAIVLAIVLAPLWATAQPITRIYGTYNGLPIAIQTTSAGAMNVDGT